MILPMPQTHTPFPDAPEADSEQLDGPSGCIPSTAREATLPKDHVTMSASPRIAPVVIDRSESLPTLAHNPVEEVETQANAQAPQQPDAGSAPTGPETEAVLAVVARLEDLLREETAGLRGASIESLKAMNHRKSQFLLEFTRAARGLGEGPPHPRLATGLQRLSAVIAENQNALSTHFEAVREIAGIIAETMRAHESDGTYADRPAPRGTLGQDGMRAHAATGAAGGGSR